MTITKHYTVIGKVQEVGYRDYVKKAADAVGLMGVANHGDNSDIVIVVAQGDGRVFAEFERTLRFGPVMAFVKSIDSNVLEKSAYYRSFQVEGIVLSTKLTETLEKMRREGHAITSERALIQFMTPNGETSCSAG